MAIELIGFVIVLLLMFALSLVQSRQAKWLKEHPEEAERQRKEIEAYLRSIRDGEEEEEEEVEELEYAPPPPPPVITKSAPLLKLPESETTRNAPSRAKQLIETVDKRDWILYHTILGPPKGL